MKVLVRKFPTANLKELEAKLNEALQKPSYKGYGVASTFMSPDDKNLVVILQHPGDASPAPAKSDA